MSIRSVALSLALLLFLAHCSRKPAVREPIELSVTPTPVYTIGDVTTAAGLTAPTAVESQMPTATETAVPYPPPATFTRDAGYPGQSTATPVTPSPTFTAEPTPLPLPPRPTPVPTIDLSSLSPATSAAIGVWRRVDGDFPYPVMQISDTQMGVAHVEWAPDGERLLLEMALGEVYPIGSTPATTPIVLTLNDAGWATGGFGSDGCLVRSDWSPDGGQLAFTRDRDVWVANADGSAARRLPAPPDRYSALSLRFSPSGDHLAVLVDRTDAGKWHHDLWLYHLATGAENLLIGDAGAGAFTWSPAGDSLAHLAMVNDSSLAPVTARLWIAPLFPSAGEPISFADLDDVPATEACFSAPQWVLGGEKVAASVMLRQGIWLVDRNGEALHLPPEAERFIPMRSGNMFSASADGHYVAYSGSDTGSNRAAGGDGFVYDLAADTFVTRIRQMAGRGVWSPVLPQLAFQSWPWSLWVIDAAHGGVRRIDPGDVGPAPLRDIAAWSPDGTQLAYWKQDSGGYSLWLTALDGEPRKLMSALQLDAADRNPNYVYDMTPSWAPDGRALAVAAIRDTQPEAYLVEFP